jgi:hypothetical protein
MARRPTVRHPLPLRARQGGVALLVMVTIIALGASWMLLSSLNEASSRTALSRQDNARVLGDAKHALTGWMIRQAIEAGENNPGRLPCPEAAGYIGTANEGIAAGNCTLPAVGRLPWRTLGLPKLRDASGEPLWYVVSPGWALPTVSSMLTINSNSLGQLTLDGTANAAVALVIAPGPALNVQVSAGCTARTQLRTASTPDFRDYLECENATSPVDASFVTNGPTASFNDQVVALTARDLLPGLEAAIAKRIEREIVPQLQSVFAAPSWGMTGVNRVYPFAAPFANPGPGSGTSDYRGVLATYWGLLPFNQTQGCTASASNPRCLPDLVGWMTTPWAYEAGGWGYIQTESCYWEAGTAPYYTARVCDGEYHEDDLYPANPGLIIALQAKFSNVALGLRALDSTKVEIFAHEDPLPFNEGIAEVIPTTSSVTLNVDGSATVTVSGQLPNIDSRVWDTYAVFRIRVRRQIIGDHALLDANHPTTGWFVRNDWFRLLYYATSRDYTAEKVPTPSCGGKSCLRLTWGPDTIQTNDKRALLILAGRSLANVARPNAQIADYLEFENADGNRDFEQQPIRTWGDAALKAPFNDRVVVVDQN